MLDFSPVLNESNYLNNCLFPSVSTSIVDWSIYDSSTKLIIKPTELKNIIQETTRFKAWQWPAKKLFFISDIHADANALISSLILSGTIKKTGIRAEDFILTKKNKKSRIIIGGDCLDKGPSNLYLLRTLKKLFDLKKNTILLAGNHDIRLYMGLKSLCQTDPVDSSHFFIRMGKKGLPLLKEVYNEYLNNNQVKDNLLTLDFCRQALFPPEEWQEHFIENNKERMSLDAIELELSKVNKKLKSFESDCLDHGLNLIMVYQAAQKCKALFLDPKGEFYWFFNKMKLIHREKSFLFTHAGLDNKITKKIKKSGIKKINQKYKSMLDENLCQFYYGSMANLLRTKYRKTDPVFDEKGVKRLHRLGIHAVVHGHVSQSKGQKINLRSGMLHIECDVTLDRNSREKAGLPEFGAGVTSISSKGKIKGISNDFPQIKLFQPESHFFVRN
ncbi:MAG: metallophosphoesterase [Gammaproteobacteria bacterium]|nr:metallophosphoesterase [Gammaproteobacteria bacterium]